MASASAPRPRRRPEPAALALFAALVPPVTALGQEVPFLVRDITTATRDAGPSELTVSGGSLLFTIGSDGIQGAFAGELWKTDGTAAGTVVVKDINPGPIGSSISDL